MEKAKPHLPATIDAYIAACDAPIQPVLHELRALIQECAPEASEKISYGMPTFYLNGNLIHFAAQKHHIGLYPAPSGIAYFAKEFDRLGLKYSKGAVQFPKNKPLPAGLIREIVRYRVEENTKDGAKRKK